jgi:tetratricopeptide (TPR) repeat protein
MLDFNYFKNDAVLFFITLTSIFFVGVIFYRKYHGIKFRSIVSIFMTLFYLAVIFIGIYTTYYEVLANYYFEKGLYEEASYRFINAENLKKSTIYSFLDNFIIEENKDIDKNKMMAFYASKNYNRAIPYLKNGYKKESNIKRSIFIKLYLAHSYLETGNKKGTNLFLSVYLEAICYLDKNDLDYFEGIIKLNTNLRECIKFENL